MLQRPMILVRANQLGGSGKVLGHLFKLRFLDGTPAGALGLA